MQTRKAFRFVTCLMKSFHIFGKAIELIYVVQMQINNTFFSKKSLSTLDPAFFHMYSMADLRKTV